MINLQVIGSQYEWVKFTAPNLSLKNIDLLESECQFLSSNGLPIILKNGLFIPSTFIQSFVYNDITYYCLGGFNKEPAGVSIAIIEKNSSNLYYFSRRKDNGDYLVFLNSSISKFVFFLIKYNVFSQRYSIKFAEINVVEIIRDYEIMKQELAKEDQLAMELGTYWGNLIEGLRADYAEFL